MNLFLCSRGRTEKVRKRLAGGALQENDRRLRVYAGFELARDFKQYRSCPAFQAFESSDSPWRAHGPVEESIGVVVAGELFFDWVPLQRAA